MVFQTYRCNDWLSSRIFQPPNINLGLSAMCGTMQLLLQKSRISCGIKMVQKEAQIKYIYILVIYIDVSN